MAIKVVTLSYCLMMRIIRIIAQILILYVFYYIGVFIVEITGLPLPASILGLVLLAFCLKMNWVKVDYIREGAGFLIAFMTLFFIPATVGIIDYPELLSVEGVLLIGTVFVSTLFAILISSKFSEMIEKKELELIKKKEINTTSSKEQESSEKKTPLSLERAQPNLDKAEELAFEKRDQLPIGNTYQGSSEKSLSIEEKELQPSELAKEDEELEGSHLHR